MIFSARRKHPFVRKWSVNSLFFLLCFFFSANVLDRRHSLVYSQFTQPPSSLQFEEMFIPLTLKGERTVIKLIQRIGHTHNTLISSTSIHSPIKLRVSSIFHKEPISWRWSYKISKFVFLPLSKKRGEKIICFLYIIVYPLPMQKHPPLSLHFRVNEIDFCSSLTLLFALANIKTDIILGRNFLHLEKEIQKFFSKLSPSIICFNEAYRKRSLAPLWGMNNKKQKEGGKWKKRLKTKRE